MLVEKNVPLQPYNTFHIVAKAHSLVRVTSEDDVPQVIAGDEITDLIEMIADMALVLIDQRRGECLSATRPELKPRADRAKYAKAHCDGESPMVPGGFLTRLSPGGASSCEPGTSTLGVK